MPVAIRHAACRARLEWPRGKTSHDVACGCNPCLKFSYEEQIMAEVGKAAPEFKLKAHDGGEISLSQYQGARWVVISAYPFAFTGG